MNDIIEPCVGCCVFVHARTVVNSDFLAQASMSCLSEINRGSPKLLQLKRPTSFLSKRASRPSERSLAWARAFRLSETLQPERGAGRGSVVLGCLLVLDDWHLLGYDCYDEKYVMNCYVWVIWFMDGEWWVWYKLDM